MEARRTPHPDFRSSVTQKCLYEEWRHLNWTAIFLKSSNVAAINHELKMTKTELQIVLAAATRTNKKTAAVFLDTLSNLGYKAIKKNGEFVLPGFGKLVRQKRKARTGFNPKTQQKIKIPAKTVVKFRIAKVAKDAILGGKKVVRQKPQEP
jgi:DNA-binding protein HU-beta